MKTRRTRRTSSSKRECQTALHCTACIHTPHTQCQPLTPLRPTTHITHHSHTCSHSNLLVRFTVDSKKSKDLTDARFSTMRSRDEKMNALKHSVLEKLSQVSTSPQYPQLLRFLIAQGLMTLMENNVTLQVRKEDLAIAKKELAEATRLFQDTMKQSSGVTPSISVSVDEKEFLPSGMVSGKEGASCAGGVLLSARNGQILCRNTLDHRLELAFDALKPTVRGTLFGVREKIEIKQEKKKGHGVSLPK